MRIIVALFLFAGRSFFANNFRFMDSKADWQSSCNPCENT